MSFVLVVQMKVKPGEEERAAALINQLAVASRQEPGCELYIPCHEPGNPASFLFFEQYRDQEAYEAHGASEHFEGIAREQLFPLLESRERTFYLTM